jgi:hypothetical protein
MRIFENINKNKIIEKVMMWFFFGLLIFTIFISLHVIKKIID